MVNNQLRKKLRMIALTSMATVFIAGFFVTLLHELSHGVICQAEGNKFTFELTLTGGIGYCEGEVRNVTAFLAMGGFVASGFSAMVALFVRRYHRGIFIGMATLAIGQFANMILETFLYSFYMGTGGLVSIQVVVLATWMTLITCYVRKEANRVKLTT